MTLLLYYPCLCCYSFLRKHAVSLSGSESVQVFLICLYTSCHWRSNLISFKGLSWTRLYGSWIYNYLCNQCLSPLMLWVRISIRARCTTLCEFVSDLQQVGDFLPVLSFPPPIKLTDITEILLKVVLNAIKQTNNQFNLEGRMDS